MTMAVEGANQLAEDSGSHVSGYGLRDVHFLQSPMIPLVEEGVEVVMQLEPRHPRYRTLVSLCMLSLATL